MDKIEFALKLAKDCTYADEVTDSAKRHLRSVINEALVQLNQNNRDMNNPFRKDELEQMLEFIKENPQVLNPIGAGGKITSSPLVQYILERLHGLNQNKEDEK